MTLVKQLPLTFKFFLGSLFCLSHAPKALRYSYWKDKVERQITVLQDSSHFALPEILLRAEAIAGRIYFYFEQAKLEVCFLTSDLVRIDWKPGLPPIPYAIAQQEWAPTKYRLDKTTDGYAVSSQTSENATGLKIAVENNGRAKVSDTAGNLLRKELPPEKLGEEWI
jgi:alpha-glucosidase